MNTRLPLYTPSLLEPQVLEATFVKREPLLRDLLEKQLESVTSNNKHFSLLIGPRGIGKTHLLSLLNHRIKNDPQLAEHTAIAWLREEEWGVASYLDLLIQILNAIAVDTSELYQHDNDQAVLLAEKQILAETGDKVLLVISENMNMIFDGLGIQGQHQFRAFIQNSGKLTIVAAAQSLFNGVTHRNNPFYGFFSIEHLQPLNINEAMTLLISIAKLEQKEELVALLNSTTGQFRVRALHHLANGNPRIYVIFAQLVRAATLDQFTDVILQMLDELTPYYQAKMMQISPQQRKLVQFLCRKTGTATVTEIAKYTHLKHQAVSSQLKILKDNGYVQSHSVGRTSHYEIAEPLMRLVLEVKESQAEPVRLIINFIRHWFSTKARENFTLQNNKQPWLKHDLIKQALENKDNGNSLLKLPIEIRKLYQDCI